MAQLIKTNGEIVTVTPKNGKEFELEELQRLVGGPIEYVGREQGKRMVWCDEEGKLRGRAPNHVASERFRGMLGVGDWLVGDVLVTERGEVS
jgi:hypothetical protein